MTKISEYSNISTPTIDDLLIGTDVELSNETKNFTIESLIDLTLENGVSGTFYLKTIKLLPLLMD